MRDPVLRILLQLNKLTFWRLPTAQHKKKRKILRECTTLIEKALFHPKESKVKRREFTEPFINLEIVKDYKSIFCWPTKQGILSDGDDDIQPGQEADFGHYQSSSKFVKRFKNPKFEEKVEEVLAPARFTIQPLWKYPNEIALSVDGYSTVESVSKKLVTGFHLKVQHGTQTWKVIKSYYQFERLEENVSIKDKI